MKDSLYIINIRGATCEYLHRNQILCTGEPDGCAKKVSGYRAFICSQVHSTDAKEQIHPIQVFILYCDCADNRIIRISRSQFRVVPRCFQSLG